MNITERIEKLRTEQGISLTHLNKKIGAYRGKITDVKNGKTSFSDIEIEILSKELSTTTDYLLGRTDNPSPADTESKNIFQDKKYADIYSKIILLDEIDSIKVSAYIDGLLSAEKYSKKEERKNA